MTPTATRYQPSPADPYARPRAEAALTAAARRAGWDALPYGAGATLTRGDLRLTVLVEQCGYSIIVRDGHPLVSGHEIESWHPGAGANGDAEAALTATERAARWFTAH